MIHEYTTPSGEYSRLYGDMLQQVHLLIAGATGAGKSTVVNGIMHAAMFHSPAAVRFILIDPKGTELSEYADLPHTIRYAQETTDCVRALSEALDITRTRFADMKRNRSKMYNGSDIYIIIDELMYLLNRPEYKRKALDMLQDILVIARAARVHVIACTQFIPMIPTCLRCNFDSKLALRTATAQDSRNVIGVRGCECFPVPSIAHVAYGAYMTGGITTVYQLTQIPDADRARLIQHWTRGAGRARRRLFA